MGFVLAVRITGVCIKSAQCGNVTMSLVSKRHSAETIQQEEPSASGTLAAKRNGVETNRAEVPKELGPNTHGVEVSQDEEPRH